MNLHNNTLIESDAILKWAIENIPVEKIHTFIGLLIQNNNDITNGVGDVNQIFLPPHLVDKINLLYGNHRVNDLRSVVSDLTDHIVAIYDQCLILEEEFYISGAMRWEFSHEVCVDVDFNFKIIY